MSGLKTLKKASLHMWGRLELQHVVHHLSDPGDERTDTENVSHGSPGQDSRWKHSIIVHLMLGEGQKAK